MLSLGQKVVAVGTILLLDVVLFVFSPLLGVIGLFASAPLALALLAR
jgi:hypothetical protein